MKQSRGGWKNLRQKRECLVRLLLQLREQQEQQQLLQQQHRLREQVLADLCQCLDGIAQLRTQSQPSQSTCAAGTHADQMQHPRAGVSRSTDASSAHASNSSVGADLQLQSVLEAVPAYCCTADLLSKATPQLTALVASLTATDISRLMTYTFYEVVVLLEFTSRKVPHPAPEAAAAWAAAPPAADDPQQTTSWPFLQHESELQAVVDRFFGLLTIVMATNPMPLIQAMCLNHRTQQQETPPPDHWENMVLSVRLTSQQATYLTTAWQEVAQIRKNSISQLGRLAEHAGSPSLLLLAAQKQTGQAQQRPVQQTPPGTAASPAGSPASPEAPAAGCCPVKEVQLSCLFDHMALYGVLVAFVVLDSLTTTQKARWLVSSYPWVPGPVILCAFARRQLQQLQQAASGQEQEPGSVSSLYAAPDDDPHMQECAACQQHLQQRRQRWQQQLQQQQQKVAEAAADDWTAAAEESDSMS